MKIVVASIFVEDQEKALKFYTEKLGLVKKRDVSHGQYRWLTVVSADDQNGTELLLEP
ncbi:MAG: Glyoxalase/bleomycin resistance protein/dioxygenase, partial [Parcubacteria group bacterium GW2011_GWA1_49_11]